MEGSFTNQITMEEVKKSTVILKSGEVLVIPEKEAKMLITLMYKEDGLIGFESEGRYYCFDTKQIQALVPEDSYNFELNRQ